MAVLVGGDTLMGLEAMSEEDFLDAAEKTQGRPVFVRGHLGELVIGESLGIGSMKNGGLVDGSLMIKEFPVDGRERTHHIPRHNVHKLTPIVSEIIARASGNDHPSAVGI